MNSCAYGRFHSTPGRALGDADLHGKAGHIRTVPIPLWVKEAMDRWTEASGIKEGCRGINKSGQIWGQGMTPRVLWQIVKKAADDAGIDKLAPHASP